MGITTKAFDSTNRLFRTKSKNPCLQQPSRTKRSRARRRCMVKMIIMHPKVPIPGTSVGVHSSKCKAGAKALIPSDLLLTSLESHVLCNNLKAGEAYAVTLISKTDGGDPLPSDPLWRVRLNNKDRFPKGPRATILQSQLFRYVIESPAENIMSCRE